MDNSPTDYLSGLGGLQNLPSYANTDAGLQATQALRTTALQQQAAQLQLQQQQTQQARAQAFQSDLVGVGSNPTPDGIAGMIRKYPEFATQLKSSYDVQDQAKKDSDFHVQSQIWSAAHSGNYDLAASLLQAHHDASVAAGQPQDPTDIALITALKSGDPEEQKRAESMIGMSVAAINPDKFAETYKIIKPDDGNGYTLTPGAQRFDANNKLVASAPPEDKNTYNADVFDANGNKVGTRSGTMPSGPSGGTLPTALPDIVSRIATIEGTGQNPKSSANGVGQFTNATWLSTYKSANPNSGLSDAQILAQRADPMVATQMLGNLVQKNAAALQSNDLPVTADNIYITHFLGTGGGIRALKASPDTPISKVATQQQIAANPTTLGKFATVGDLRQWAAGKMAAGVSNSGASGDPSQVPIGGGSPFMAQPGGAAFGLDPNLTGDAAMAALQHTNPGVANRIAGIMAGKIPYPNATRKDTQPLLNAISQVDPTFDATTWKARNETNAQYAAGGAAGKILTSGATAVSHLYDLAMAAQKLPDHYLGWVNKIENNAAPVGSDTGKNLIQFNRSRTLYAPEVSKYLAGTGQAPEGETKKHYESFDPSLGRTGNLNNLVTDTKFITDKFDAQAAAYQHTMGKPLSIDGAGTTGPVTAKLEALRWWSNNPSKPVPVIVNTAAESHKLAPGTVYVRPDGTVMTR